MEMNEIRDRLVAIMTEKHPEAWSLENRYINLTKEVAELGQAIMFMNGSTRHCNPHNSAKHLLACIMLDLYMLSDLLHADLEKENILLMEFFKTGKKSLHLTKEELLKVID